MKEHKGQEVVRRGQSASRTGLEECKEVIIKRKNKPQNRKKERMQVLKVVLKFERRLKV